MVRRPAGKASCENLKSKAKDEEEEGDEEPQATRTRLYSSRSALSLSASTSCQRRYQPKRYKSGTPIKSRSRRTTRKLQTPSSLQGPVPTIPDEDYNSWQSNDQNLIWDT